MEAKELRSGNFIIGTYENEDDYKIHETICEFKFYDCYDNFYHVESKDNICDFTGFKPIPLTEEWLLKFKFKQTNEDNDIKWFTKKRLDIVIGEVNFIVFDHLVLKHIKYVHQFQNLYFSIIGKELTLTNPTEIKNKLL